MTFRYRFIQTYNQHTETEGRRHKGREPEGTKAWSQDGV